MKVIVIPDVHLKPWMFARAAELLRQGAADRAVCLMDLADDWDKQFRVDEYEKTYDAAIAFAEEFPDTLWCYGNHDLCYLWNKRESGYSSYAADIVVRKLRQLEQSVPSPESIQYIQRIDDVIFCHGGLLEYYAEDTVEDYQNKSMNEILAEINSHGATELWREDSVIWYRPQYSKCVRMFGEGKLLQVVGHTPVEQIERCRDVISCDVFSLYPDGKPVGSCEFPVIDTETKQFTSLK